MHLLISIDRVTEPVSLQLDLLHWCSHSKGERRPPAAEGVARKLLRVISRGPRQGFDSLHQLSVSQGSKGAPSLRWYLEEGVFGPLGCFSNMRP